MHHSIESHFFAGFLLFCPISICFFGCLPASWLNKRSYYRSVLASQIAFFGFISSVVAWIFLMNLGPLFYFISIGNTSIEVCYFDPLSATALLLISFLLFTVLRFSYNYLKGDPRQGRFTKWLCLTGGSVLFLVISGNLVQFSFAWISTSICLHQLLEFYPERPGALLAARKKFIISRVGDACLIAVIVLVFKAFHTWNFSPLFAQAKSFNADNKHLFIPHLNAICLLLVGGAMLKSAQFPFHSWLPDTMETPTPVSALMHAGIINAGGFLIIRMGSLVSLSHPAMATLAFFGAITALLGSFVMLTHSSVKRVLAFSTIAQMGFMMLECGLGAFSLALLHLVSHSLYKAYAFLSSGTINRLGRSFLSPSNSKSFQVIPLAFSFLFPLPIVWAVSSFIRISAFTSPHNLVLSTFFSFSIGFFLWNLWSQKWTPLFFSYGILAATVICSVEFVLHRIFQDYILVTVSNNFQTYSLLEYVLIGFLILLFLLVLFIQMEVPKRLRTRLLSSLYVHARNGFYFNTLFNRWVSTLWPLDKRQNP